MIQNLGVILNWQMSVIFILRYLHQYTLHFKLSDTTTSLAASTSTATSPTASAAASTSISKLWPANLRLTMKMPCENNMSKATHRSHMAIMYFHSSIETLYFIILTSSKNGVWSEEYEVNMHFYRRLKPKPALVCSNCCNSFWVAVLFTFRFRVQEWWAPYKL